MAKIDFKKLGAAALAETVFLLALAFAYDNFVVSLLNNVITQVGQTFQLSALGIALSFEAAIAIFIVFTLKGLLVALVPTLEKYTY